MGAISGHRTAFSPPHKRSVTPSGLRPLRESCGLTPYPRRGREPPARPGERLVFRALLAQGTSRRGVPQLLDGDVLQREVAHVVGEEDALGVLGEGGNQSIGGCIPAAFVPSRAAVACRSGSHLWREVEVGQEVDESVHSGVAPREGACVELSQGNGAGAEGLPGSEQVQ